jgi:leukotriene-A4 hydrolase
VLGLQSLQRDMQQLVTAGDRGLTHLAMDVRGRDPDDAFSDVPYEKGRLFIGFLESRVGRERLDVFLRNYFDRFSFHSIYTEQFRKYLDEQLLKLAGKALTLQEVDAWLYGPDLPPSAVLPSSDAFSRIDAQVKRWLNNASPQTALATKQWSTHEWLYFLDNLPAGVTSRHLQELDRAFELTQAPNAEIAHSWLKNAIRLHYEPAYKRLEQYLTTIGRRKLVRDLYEDLMKTPAGAERARQIYAKARPMYHVQLSAQLDEIVRSKEAESSSVLNQ